MGPRRKLFFMNRFFIFTSIVITAFTFFVIYPGHWKIQKNRGILFLFQSENFRNDESSSNISDYLDHIEKSTTPDIELETDTPPMENSHKYTTLANEGIHGEHTFAKEASQDILQMLLAEDDEFGQYTCPNISPALWTQNPDRLRNGSVPSCTLMLNSSLAPTPKHYDTLLKASRQWKPPDPHNEGSLLNLVSDCDSFRENLSFPTNPASKEEAEYSLAYVFMAQRNIAQTVRLFRMIYQPQNVYCIAYDTKSNEDYIKTISAMASCFPSNVFLNPKPEKIHYFGYSILRSVMNCMTVLHKSSVKWKYVQVVSWNDFPLRTNLEMVRIFKILNGSQDCELLRDDTPDYVTYKYGRHGEERRRIPPGGSTLYKGSFATSMSRDFVEFMLTDRRSIKLYQYLEDSKCAEEYYWTTLVHNIQLDPPGGFPGQCRVFYSNAGEKKPFLSRFQVWQWDKGDRTCKGQFVTLSCLYGSLDLPMLLERMELMAHKLYEEFDPALLYCLEEWYWRRTCSGQSQLDLRYYQNLPSVRYQKLGDEEKDSFVCKL